VIATVTQARAGQLVSDLLGGANRAFDAAHVRSNPMPHRRQRAVAGSCISTAGSVDGAAEGLWHSSGPKITVSHLLPGVND
jgi:hypothetical protein